MKFEVRDVLQSRGPIEGNPPEEVESLLVGESSVACWQANHGRYGHDQCSLFPAWSNGERAWLLQEVWCASSGYSAWGTRESILEFQAGVAALAQHGKWEPIFGQPQLCGITRTVVGND